MIINLKIKSATKVASEIFYLTKEQYSKKSKKYSGYIFYDPFSKKLKKKYSSLYLPILVPYNNESLDAYKEAVSEAVMKDAENLYSLNVLTQEDLLDKHLLEVHSDVFFELEISYCLLTDLDKDMVLLMNSYIEDLKNKEIKFIIQEVLDSNLISDDVYKKLYINGPEFCKTETLNRIEDPDAYFCNLNYRFKRYKIIKYSIISILIFLIAIPAFIWGYNYNNSIIYAFATTIVTVPTPALLLLYLFMVICPDGYLIFNSEAFIQLRNKHLP